MEQNIIITNLNDFIFCPRSIYFHNLYSSFDENLYHTSYQKKGQNAHKTIDNHKYSTQKAILEGITIYSWELGVMGRIDLFDADKGVLTERKNKIKYLYEGYFLQIYAQYYCLIEMGYTVNKLRFHSVSDNKIHDVPLPGEGEKIRLKEIIMQMNTFNLDDKSFKQNPNKCTMCIYKELCDYYKGE